MPKMIPSGAKRGTRSQAGVFSKIVFSEPSGDLVFGVSAACTWVVGVWFSAWAGAARPAVTVAAVMPTMSDLRIF